MKLFFSTLLAIFILSGVLIFPQFVSRMYSNWGMYYLVDGMTSTELGIAPMEQLIESLISRSLQWHSDNNATAWRSLGFVHWFREGDDKAFHSWEHLNLMATDYVKYGNSRLLAYQNREEAIRWYKLAQRLEPTHQELWRYVGRLCQNQFESGICDDYLHYNEHNWIVDSDFVFDQAAWRLNRTDELTHKIDVCPGIMDQKCATTITGTVRDNSTTWYQCLHLEAGQEYKFSSWLRIEAQENTRWRPLYFQGNIDGTPSGSWSGNQQGSSDWTYWERTFVVPQWDESWACFHPIRIGANARIWFYDTRLEILTQIPQIR